jgi:hypothetical protein
MTRRRLDARPASRTNWRGPSNSASRRSPGSNSRLTAWPVAFPRPLPIFAPSEPPTNPPRATPAIGSAFLATPLRAPPIACPMGGVCDTAECVCRFVDEMAEDCSNACSLLPRIATSPAARGRSHRGRGDHSGPTAARAARFRLTRRDRLPSDRVKRTARPKREPNWSA